MAGGRPADLEGEAKAWKGLSSGTGLRDPSALKVESAVGICVAAASSARIFSSPMARLRSSEGDELGSARRRMVVSSLPAWAWVLRDSRFFPSCLITSLSYSKLGCYSCMSQ